MKRVLNFDADYDFSLLGISCHAKDYRLSWELNQALGIDLSKNEHEDGGEENGDGFSTALYYDEERHLEYTLLSNKSSIGTLIPEHGQLDYFLMISGPQHEVEADDCRSKMQTLDMILAVLEIRPDQLKSKSNLIF